MSRYFLISFLLLFTSYSGLSQEFAPEIPVVPGQFFNFSGLYNPSSTDPFYKAKASSAYQSYTGIRRNRKILFLDAYMSAGSKEKNRYHSCLGITATSQKTGDYINRNRFHFLYAYQMPISASHSLIAGASAGIYNSFISNNPSGVSYSILSPDGNFSLSLRHRSYSISAGVNQLFNNRLNQDRELVLLKRFYMTQINYYAELGSTLKLKTGFLLRMVPDFRTFSSFYATVDYNRRVGGGIIFHENQGGIIGNIYHSPNGKNELGISFSYHFPVGKNVIINSNTYNISLNLLMHRITF